MDRSSKKILTISAEYEFDEEKVNPHQIKEIVDVLNKIGNKGQGLIGYTICDGKMTKSVDFNEAQDIYNYDEYESESGW